MKIILIGGTGHVGQAIKQHLTANNYDVIDISRSGTISVDIRNPDFVDYVMKRVKNCDVIIHCAASLSKSAADVSISSVNCLGTQQVLNLAFKTGASHFIYISSLQVIGRPFLLPITEEHPANPLTAYHASKLYGEHLVLLSRNIIPYSVCLRITSPIGQGTPSGRIFSEFIRSAKQGKQLVLSGKGTRIQNYINVCDIAEAVSSFVKTNAFGIFNIAGSKSYSNYELAYHCVNVLKSDSIITYSGIQDPDDELNWIVSIQKARTATGWLPNKTLTDSILEYSNSNENCHN